MAWPTKRPGYGTLVTRPAVICGQGYVECTGCGLKYTRFGIARHWPHCPGLQPRKNGLGYEAKETK